MKSLFFWSSFWFRSLAVILRFSLVSFLILFVLRWSLSDPAALLLFGLFLFAGTSLDFFIFILDLVLLLPFFVVLLIGLNQLQMIIFYFLESFLIQSIVLLIESFDLVWLILSVFFDLLGPVPKVVIARLLWSVLFSLGHFFGTAHLK